ncbi:sugar ABC transporter permease [Cohnella herbarum]|uniref:Sugar ABC transporter permease n=2 Tax=Cohnella herbarum TaxID=2728023 RepID=A0A7Z2VQA6_9BACL|nr:sugar ABC transporter permease [Cohnella herbarum]
MGEQVVNHSKPRRSRLSMKRAWPFYALLAPAFIVTFIFQYLPMFGIVIAFQDFKPWEGVTGSAWVGWDNFSAIFTLPDSRQVIVNTLVISSMKIVTGITVPFVFALLLNEVRHMLFKRTVQTLVYLPYFLSWVILGGILIDVLSVKGGIVNQFLGLFGVDEIFFLGDGFWFRVTVIVTDIWKEFGFSAIVYLAALAGINPSLYEAAVIDGANRWKQTLYVTIPSIMPVVVVVGTLSLGNILNAGFDQIFNLYNPLVYSQGDVIDTFVYRNGLVGGAFSFGAAVGLFKSVISFILIAVTYYLAYRFGKYRIF